MVIRVDQVLILAGIRRVFKVELAGSRAGFRSAGNEEALIVSTQGTCGLQPVDRHRIDVGSVQRQDRASPGYGEAPAFRTSGNSARQGNGTASSEGTSQEGPISCGRRCRTARTVRAADIKTSA